MPDGSPIITEPVGPFGKIRWGALMRPGCGSRHCAADATVLHRELVCRDNSLTNAAYGLRGTSIERRRNAFGRPASPPGRSRRWRLRDRRRAGGRERRLTRDGREARPRPSRPLSTSPSRGGRTQLRVTLSEPVEAHAQLMERPDRVIVDLPEVAFHLPAETGQRREGLIASYPLRPVRARALAGGDRPRPAGGRGRHRGRDRRAGRRRPMLVVELKPGRPGRIPPAAAAERASRRPSCGRRPCRRARRDERPVDRHRSRATAASIPAPPAPDGVVEKEIVFALCPDSSRKSSRPRVVTGS